ncbi:MAG: class I SAM-dependent methyltransferase [Gammaproteobacteria bacterium]|nr:class I SAM-dependent methyltransferase [Sideroxydans sp.]MBU3903655.1 class I SAM-dependent methyltransferase [Gammaproteobacteria bacterium]MBU4045335.1 class I SAM-dependent methyltransferase [Gammaproteobacteria bacterium]MBU4151206.1 class I SAM-dependent methyltransferase [Gammaproteobacteria bacterium]
MSDHWQNFSHHWNRLGSPMRPCAEDIGNFRAALGDTPGNCLLLGVTPELAGVSAQLTALDNSADMIRALWPQDKRAILGEWLDMPFEDASFDNVVGDGCPVLLEFPQQQTRFFAEIARVLKPGGKLVLRAFVCAAQAESPEQVCHEAMQGNIKGFHAFKWRLSMAIASQTPGYTFRIAESLRTFDRHFPDRQQLVDATGWDMQDVATLDLYRDSAALYSYPPLSELRKILPKTLVETGLMYGHYELAERCPLLVLERRA